MTKWLLFLSLSLFLPFLGCSDDKTTVPTGLSRDAGTDTVNDIQGEPDASTEKCDETSQETCLNLGFYGGDLVCSDGIWDSSGCLQCPAHLTESTGSLGDKWTKTGPPGGNITALLALENDVLLAGTGRTFGRAGARPLGYGTGIYRSEDGGKTFKIQQSFFSPNGNKVHNFSRVGTSDRIYATVSASSNDENGIWMSDDAGVSWSDVSAGLHDSARPRWVSVAPGEPERVYLTVEGAPGSTGSAVHSLYRRDGGADWTRIAANGTGSIALAIRALDRETVLLLGSKDFYRSVNGGEDFTAFPFDLPNPTSSLYIPKFVVDPADSDHIFRTTENVSLAESNDGGETWSEVGLGFGQTDIALIDDEVLITTRSGGLQVWTDGKFTSRGDCLLTPDPTAISVAPDNPQKIYLGFNGQGVLRSTDGGKTFAAQAAGIDDLLAKVIVTGPNDAPVAWIVSPAGLFRSIDSGDTWNRVADNQGTLAFNTVAQDPNDANRVLVGTHGDWYAGGGESAGVFELNLAQGSIKKVGDFRGSAPAINGIHFDPSDPNIVYVYQDEGGRESDGGSTLMHVSKDGGKTFTPGNILSKSFTGNTTCSGNQFAISPAGIPYFCSRPLGEERTVSIYTSKDKGTTFEVLWTGESSSLGNVQRYFPYAGMYVDKEENIYFTGAGENGLAISTDGGNDFGDFGEGLSSFATQTWDMTFTPSGGILVATSDGVQYAENGVDFVPINEGFESFSPRSPRGNSIAFIPGTNVVLYATVYGVFRRTLP